MVIHTELVDFVIQTDVENRMERQEEGMAEEKGSLQSLQSLMIEVYRSMIGVTSHTADEAILLALEKIARFVSADRAFVVDYDFDKQIFHNSYEWCATGIEPQIQQLQAGPLCMIDPWVRAHMAGEPVVVEDVSLLRAGPLRQMLERQSIRSILTVPFMHDGVCQGFVGFDAVKKSVTYVETDQLLLVGFSQSLQNMRKFLQQEAALEAAEKRKSALINSLDEIIMVVDEHLVYREVYAKDPDILAYQRENILNTHIETESRPSHPDYREALLHTFETGKSTRIEYQMQVPRGLRWFEMNITSLQVAEAPQGKGLREVICAVRDITNTKMLAHELRESEEKYRTLANDLPAMICVYQADTTLSFVNKTYASFYRKNPEEMIGHSFLEFLPPTRRDPARKSMQQLTVTDPVRVSVYQAEQEGAVCWHEFRDRGRFDEAGQLVQVQAIGFDITERIRSEQALKESNEKLALAKQQADAAAVAKGRFLASMSHEIKTPLNGMMGMLQLLGMTELTDEQAAYLQAAHTSSRHLLQLLNEILDYSKLESGKTRLEMHPLDVRDLLMEVEAFVKPMIADKNLSMKMIVSEEIPRCLYGDGYRLKQVLTNLMDNAVKFTGSGSIWVQVDVMHRNQDQMTLLWMVKDTGVGVPMEQQNYIFDEFTQADNSTTRHFGGTGLGLAISKGIVELMQGRIWAESDGVSGSTFFFTTILDVRAGQGA